MIEGKGLSKKSESGQVTLGHLLLVIAFFMPICAVMVALKNWGGGLLRYLVAASTTLVLGALIVTLDWKLGKAVWLRSQRYSKKVQNATAIALFAVACFGLRGGHLGI